MDFGIKAAALTGLHLYEAASRGSGRTETTLQRLTSGDTLVVRSPQERSRLERECRERGLKVRVVSASSVEMLAERLHGNTSRVVMDHTAYSAIYEDAISRAAMDIESITKIKEESRGYPPHGLYPIIDIARAIGTIR